MSVSRMPVVSEDELRRPIEMRPGSWRSAEAVDVQGLEAALRRSVEGEVRFDAGTRGMYAVDASNYRQVPIGVVIPKSVDDVVGAMAACRSFRGPVLSRGGGTSLAGQCCNVGVVIDFSKYLNHILELNASENYAIVEPGTICDDLVKAARPHKLTYGPQPATHSRCVFGGMLGNNSCGAHAQMNGPAVNNTEELDILLYDGTRMTAGWLTETEWQERMREPGRIGEIFAKLMSLRQRYQGLVEKKFPKIIRRVSGYNLDQLIPDEHGRINLARVLVGSESTCVSILKAKVKLIYNHPERVILLLGYPDVYQAGDDIPEVLKYSPIALEGLDDHLMENVQKKGGPHRKYLPLLPEGKGWLMVEIGYESQQEAIEQAHRLMDELKKRSSPPSMKLFVDKQEQHNIWQLRESGLGATAFVPGERDSWPGWEDSAVAPEKVGFYLRELRGLYDKYGYNPSLYGHFGQGCIHCRVDFDLYTAAGIRHWRSFMEEATDLVVKYGGSLSGEHGDGQSRAEFLGKMFGPELVQAFREFKSIWDPDWKMNPGKVVDPYRIDENLRLGATYAPWQPPTHFQYPEDGGSFAHAVLRCVGIGKCRRTGASSEDSTMCPSFMVTREERDTTRGRAHHLWEMLHGDVLQNGWRDENVKESLDLCLSCKGCKGECPVNVDMATYKAEFLSHYWEGRLRPRSAYAFGWINKWARLASVAPSFANLFTQLPLLRNLTKLAMGTPQQRQIPAFAAQTFKAWFRKRGVRNQGSERVLLFADTFNNYFKPETAQAAVEVLEAAGYQVIVPLENLCCGRPLYDYGFLQMAQSYFDRIFRALDSEIERSTPMVVLEPSCCSVFRDELNGLRPHSAQAHKLMEQTFTLAEFLQKKAPSYQPPRLKRSAVLHGHCHHKAIMRLDCDKELLHKMELDVHELESGCCGMAGSFGYEKEKYEVSIKAGERVLLPAVRQAGLSSIIMSDGYSCKEQIEQETDRHALHTAEVLALAQRHGPHGGPSVYPEKELVEPRLRAQKRSIKRAGVVTAAALAGTMAAALLWKKRSW
ncbi:MAG TPA: FAD-linked oxidase C-terminal domain-containing protein [Terriglobales bacterium]|nr:FAD-linked oxidase C-terminal domain-containing protein [Terriglobales bacterium]